MRPRTILVSVVLLLACGLVLPAWASAEVVGHLTQVEGRVDLLKGGKLPASPVKLQDKVESGDLLRTKSQSRAQVTFIDHSILTIFPESRVGIEEYRFDAAKGKRVAVLQLFQGQAHAVILRAVQEQQPDFVIKTHTAVVKARGAELGCRVYPNYSSIMNFAGHAAVNNIFPEVKDEVALDNLQGTTVARAQPPAPSFKITAEDRQQFMNQLSMNQLPTSPTALQGGNHAGGPVAADVVAPGASSVVKDLGLNAVRSVLPTSVTATKNILANPAIVNSQVQLPTTPQQAGNVIGPTSAPTPSGSPPIPPPR